MISLQLPAHFQGTGFILILSLDTNKSTELQPTQLGFWKGILQVKGLHTDVKSNYLNLIIACFFPGLEKKKYVAIKRGFILEMKN